MDQVKIETSSIYPEKCKAREKGITVKDLARSILEDIAWNAVGPKAFKPVVELVLEDVVRDVLDAGKAGMWLNYDAVRLAFGRAICKRLGIQEN